MLLIRSILSDIVHGATPFSTRCIISSSIQRQYRKSSWEPWEDQKLISFVKHNGKKWTECVRQCLPHRTASHCQVRWVDCLDPGLHKGPMSEREIELLRQGVAELGEGHWKVLQEKYLQHRSPSMLKSTWDSVANPNLPRSHRQPWTAEEDALLLKGYAELGGPKWQQLSELYLPVRPPTTLASHYHAKLEPGMRSAPWTEDECDLLLRRVIFYGQEWKSVAEGIPGRSPAACRVAWSEKVDPSLKQPDNRSWSHEETALFWRQLHAHNGDWLKVKETLSGRSRVMLQRKFTDDLHKLRSVLGDALKIGADETRVEWRARIAGCICQWLEKSTNVDTDASGALFLKEDVDSTWTDNDLEELKAATANMHNADWSAIAYRLGKPVGQCKYQYHKQFAPDRQKQWIIQEVSQLDELVNSHWNTISEAIPGSTSEGCERRWMSLLEEEGKVQGRLTPQENTLLQKGVSVFGKNWVAIASTYLPQRSPWQCEAHWRTTAPRKIGSWTKEEDEILKFAVEKFGESSWKKVASFVPNRSTTQCCQRYRQYLSIENRKTGKWTFDERVRLMEIVERAKQKGAVNWKEVADQLGTGRTQWSCSSKHQSMIRSGNKSGLRPSTA